MHHRLRAAHVPGPAAGAAVHSLHTLCRCVPGQFAAAGTLLVRQVAEPRKGTRLQGIRLHRVRLLQLRVPQSYSAGAVLPFCQERDHRAGQGQAGRQPGA